MRNAKILQVILLGAFWIAQGYAWSEVAPVSAFAGSDTVAAGSATAPVTLDVVVTGKSGQTVSGLQAQDFTLLDNKSPLKLASFQATNGLSAKADPPVEAIILVDSINSGILTVAKERASLADLFQANGGKLALPTSLVVLSYTGFILQDHPTQDGKALQEFLNKNTGGLREHPGNGYEVDLERRRLSLRALSAIAAEEKKKPGRKLLIWISPGWASFAASNVPMTDNEREGLFASIASLSTALREARMTLYSVDPMGAGVIQRYDQSLFKGVATDQRVSYGNLILPAIATQSGGLQLYASNDIAKMVEQCMADASSYYVLNFNPPAAGHANEYHAIEVEVNKPGLKARTRVGYYAQ
jgi:VWFA-related protein